MVAPVSQMDCVTGASSIDPDLRRDDYTRRGDDIWLAALRSCSQFGYVGNQHSIL